MRYLSPRLAPYRQLMKALILVAILFSGGVVVNAQTAPTTSNRSTNEMVARIRDEGWNRSEVMQTLSYLTDVIGPRLTGSANLKRANEWTRDKLSGWGLTNAHLEAWGPFGRGWALNRFVAQVVEPQTIPLIAYPNAWSPGFDKPLVADVVFFDAKTNADLEKYKGKLAGAIVLASQLREVKPAFDPMALRQSDSNLLWYANAGPPATGTNLTERLVALGFRRRGTNSVLGASTNRVAQSGTNNAAGPGGPSGRGRFQPRYLSFLAKEGAAAVVYASSQGDGGTVFVAGASVPGPDPMAAVAPTNLPRAWATNAPAFPPQITVAAEDYNRLVRMIQQGEKLKMSVDLRVRFKDDDLMAYNTIAELPGDDLKDEIVMLGAHMDSWHAGTGATDNGAGVAATMEAMRVLATLKVKPRRTIRIGLWSGEEQGLLGSKAYVTRHFGFYTNTTEHVVLRAPSDPSDDPPMRRGSTNAASRKLVREPEYDQLSVYFNLDNGAGKIRGVYLQGNEAVRPLFRRWLEPFRDMDAQTLTLSNTSGTDHQSFDAIGLPGFQFIQDPLDYWSRTHHSNEDVLDRVPAQDLKQAAIILATFAYDAANADDMVPRKPLERN
jgi:carboxypeptidase Q